MFCIHTPSLIMYKLTFEPSICNDISPHCNIISSGGITMAKPMSISTRKSPACDTWLEDGSSGSSGGSWDPQI